MIEEPKEPIFRSLDEEEAWLDDNEDDDDFIRSYREKRMAQLALASSKPMFGEVLEITGVDYVEQVNKAGDGVHAILLLYQPRWSIHQFVCGTLINSFFAFSSPMCAQLQEIFKQLAIKFTDIKFMKSIATLCIPNFPDSNVPAVFVYYNGELTKQLIGSLVFGTGKITADEVEWVLSRAGALTTTLESDPRAKKVQSNKMYQQFDYDSDSE